MPNEQVAGAHRRWRLPFRCCGSRRESAVAQLSTLGGLRFMKTIISLLLIVACQCCFAQTDTNLLAAGDWSAAVSDNDGSTLRGRLLVYDELTAPYHARIYIELQHVFKGPGWWDSPLEIYFDYNCLNFAMRDKLDQPVPMEPVTIRGPSPSPVLVTLPCDSTMRLRADWYNLGPPSKRDGLEILVCVGCWLIKPNSTNDYFLSASFTPPKDHPSPLKYHVWQGTLKLPKVKIPVEKI